MNVSSHSMNVRGVYPALVTPFNEDGSRVDFDSLGKLVEKQLSAGVDGLVVCGSTGESLTLSDAEYKDVLAFVVGQVKGRLPCVAGISQSATSRAVDAAKVARDVGCSAVLVATPPYNKPSQAGIALHMRQVRTEGGLPVIAYNIPGRSAAAVSSNTLGELAQEGTICAVKESSGSIDTVIDTLLKIGSVSCSVLSGEDSLTLAALALGGKGVISASANALPEQFVAICRAFEKGDLTEARRVQMSIIPHIRALFIESNPVPVKSVLAWQGTIRYSTVRAPLVPLMPANADALRAVFQIPILKAA